jgi:predicted TIM-barrel fold metal-dependent hydrolase
MQIVDAHHHLWNLDAVNYPWLIERGKMRFFGNPAPIQKNYCLADFRRDHGAFAISKSVHIQVGTAPGEELAETQWLDGQAEVEGLPTAIVAYCDLASPCAAQTIAQHLAASSRVRGIRHIISRHEAEDGRNGSPALLSDPAVLSSLRVMKVLGLSFDLQLTPPHMLAASKLFGQVGDLPVALCHAGSPWRRDAEGLAEWRTGLKELAKLPLVVCKLSGLGMFDQEWTQDSLAPIVTTVLDIFGPERVMWGSNFPVDKLYRSYEGSLSALLAIVPASMHEQVFRTTAENFYRI